MEKCVPANFTRSRQVAGLLAGTRKKEKRNGAGERTRDEGNPRKLVSQTGI